MLADSEPVETVLEISPGASLVQVAVRLDVPQLGHRSVTSTRNGTDVTGVPSFVQVTSKLFPVCGY